MTDIKKTVYRVSPLTAAVFILRYSIFIFGTPYEYIGLENYPREVLLLFYLLMFSLLTVVGILRYRKTSLMSEDVSICFSEGVFLRRFLFVRKGALRSILSVRNPFHRCFGAASVRINGASFSKKLFLKKNSAALLESTSLSPNSTSARGEKKVTRSSLFSLIIASVDLTHSLTGLLAGLSILRFSSKIFRLTDALKIAETIDRKHLFLLGFLPYSLRLLAVFFLLLWGVITVLNLNRILLLEFTAEKDLLTARYGLLSIHREIFEKSSVTAYLLTAGILSCAMHRRNLWAHSKKSENSGNIPLLLGTEKSECTEILSTLYPFSKEENLQLTPAKNSRWAFCKLPLLLMLFLCALCIFPEKALPFYLSSELILPLLAVAVFLFYYGHFKFGKSFCILTEDSLRICSFKGAVLQEAFIPRENIIVVGLSAGPFKRMFSKCNLKVYVRGSRPLHFTLPYAEKKKAAQLLSKLCD